MRKKVLKSIKKNAAKPRKAPVVKPAAKDANTIYCWVSGKPIPPERVEALRSIGTPEHMMTCIEHSQTKKVKGCYMGEYGTSEMKIVDKLYNDSVRDVFKRSAVEIKDTDDDDEEEEERTREVDQKTTDKYRAIREEEEE
jgi:hypothetical protein